MRFQIQELRRARADIRSIVGWLAERSPRGARAWLSAYDDMLMRLKDHAGSCGRAQEADACKLDLRQALFRSRRGRVYRAIFFLDGPNVYILRIRGPGQAPVQPTELGMSDSNH